MADKICPFADPSRIWSDLQHARATPGLVRSETMNRWVVSRYDDIVAALHDSATFSSAPVVPTLPPHLRALFEGKVPDRGTLIGHDNPTHDRLRAAVSGFFMPRQIARYEPWIEARAHALLDDLYELGEVDFRARFSSPLPLKAISHIVGLDPDRSDVYHEALQFFTGPSPERVQPLLDYHAEIEQVIAARRTDRRDDLISHVWALRDSGDVVMTDFEMLSLFPGLMLAGHETSSNLIIMALAHMLARPGVYERAQQNDATRAEALEEAFRFEAPITGMPRRVTRPVTLGGTALEAGDEVFLAYASGNRDERFFADGDGFTPERRQPTQHIGFGQGIHACLGAPLARVLLKVEMRVIAQRLPGLRLVQPYQSRTYLPVSEVRALVDARFAWDVKDSHRFARGAHAEQAPDTADTRHAALVTAKRTIAKGVVELQLEGAGAPLGPWTPGAHAEIELPNGVVRHYSLCGDPQTPGRWTIAVLREDDGRGGSRYIHETLGIGDRLTVRPPRNHFPLREGAGPVLLIAGGIGITPLLAMAEQLARAGADWRLVYLGRAAERMAYRDRLAELDPARVTIWPADARGRFDLDAQLAAAATGTAVYCCGPEHLVAATEALGDAHGLSVHVERFAPVPFDTVDDRPFEVVIASTGQRIAVGAQESVLQALVRSGIPILSTCQRGTCGSCEVGVVEGRVNHRDAVLTREERATNETMMSCVSRCAGDRLVLRL